VPCSNAAKTQNSLKLAGVPQTTGQISAASGPKFTTLRGCLEDILLLSKFFFRLSICALVVKLCDGAQMAIFGDFFASCICSEPFAARFRSASEIHTKATRPTPCVEVWQTSNLQRLRLGEEKRRQKKPQGKNIMVCPIP